MNAADVAVLALLAVSALVGLARGLVREVLGVASWILAAVLTLRWLDPIRHYAESTITDRTYAAPIGIAIAFVLLLIVFSVLARLLARVVSASPLGGVDRGLGFFFGLARGAALLIGAYILFGLVAPVAVWPDTVQTARSLPFIYRGAVLAVAQLPSGQRPHLETPPPAGSVPPTSDPHAPERSGSPAPGDRTL